MRRIRNRMLMVLCLICWMGLSLISAQNMAVPVHVQYELLMKVLSYDRAIQAREGAELRVGVLYQSKVRASLQAQEEFVAAGHARPVLIGTKKVSFVPLDQSELGDLGAIIDRKWIDILYVAPLRVTGIAAITSLSRASRVLTLTGVPAFVEHGLAVGISVKGKRPQIVINLAAAKAEGADFTSQLLKVAKIIE
jgi:hypothetical protein